MIKEPVFFDHNENKVKLKDGSEMHLRDYYNDVKGNVSESIADMLLHSIASSVSQNMYNQTFSAILNLAKPKDVGDGTMDQRQTAAS